MCEDEDCEDEGFSWFPFTFIMMFLCGMFVSWFICVIIFTPMYSDDVEFLGSAICEEMYGSEFVSFNLKDEQLVCSKPTAVYDEMFDGLNVKVVEVT